MEALLLRPVIIIMDIFRSQISVYLPT